MEMDRREEGRKGGRGWRWIGGREREQIIASSFTDNLETYETSPHTCSQLYR